MCCRWVVSGAPKRMTTMYSTGVERVKVRRRERNAGCKIY